jgi:hypothetical protein
MRGQPLMNGCETIRKSLQVQLKVDWKCSKYLDLMDEDEKRRVQSHQKPQNKMRMRLTIARSWSRWPFLRICLQSFCKIWIWWVEIDGVIWKRCDRRESRCALMVVEKSCC